PLRAALQEVELALGGRPGTRLGERLGMTASYTTLLRLMRATPLATSASPRILGVDDWAWRRGQRYGSLLVDLERRRPVDLRLDRTSGGLLWVGYLARLDSSLVRCAGGARLGTRLRDVGHGPGAVRRVGYTAGHARLGGLGDQGPAISTGVRRADRVQRYGL